MSVNLKPYMRLRGLQVGAQAGFGTEGWSFVVYGVELGRLRAKS